MKKETGENKKSARNDFWETVLILTGVLLILAFLAFPVIIPADIMNGEYSSLMLFGNIWIMLDVTTPTPT